MTALTSTATIGPMERKEQLGNLSPGTPQTDSDAAFWLSAAAEQIQSRLVAEEVSLESARLLLRNPYLTDDLVQVLLEQQHLRSSYRWRRDLAGHRLVPLSAAMALVPGLYWRDLAGLALNVRVRPQLRRQAEQLMLQRLPKMALGERIALARIASQPVVVELRKDPNPRVFRALLENPRLTEGDLMPLAVQGGQPATIRVLLKDRRWGVRTGLRRALVRNPRTPIESALEIVVSLPKNDQRALTRDLKIREPIRRRCQVLLGEQPD